MEIVFGTELLF